MALQFVDFYPRYSEQINCLLRGKSEMWSIGFRNGLLSNRGLEEGDPFLTHLAPDYDVGFREGVSYAIYKLALHVPPTPPKCTAMVLRSDL